MKKIFSILLLITVCLMCTHNKASAQTASEKNGDYAGYQAALDTMIDADTATFVVSALGHKSEITFQVNTLKISGTVAGTIKIYGSSDGVNYGTTAIISDTLLNQSNNYQYLRTSNGFVKWKIQVITSGTVHVSQRTYVLWRK